MQISTMQKRFFVLLCFFSLLSLCPQELRAAPAIHLPDPITWVFDIQDSADLTPHGRVFLKVGGRRLLVESRTQFHFQVLDRSNYKDHAVPSSALTACSGWFAGGGEDLYAVRRAGRLRVYRRWMDEQAPEFPFKLIRSFSEVPPYRRYTTRPPTRVQ